LDKSGVARPWRGCEESTAGQNRVFRPRGRIYNTFREGQMERERTPAGQGRALIVEDEPHIRELVAFHLSLEGLTCVQTGDGNEALRLAKDGHFDLIVLDLMLPGLDGVTVCRAVRRDSPNAETPILMLTARSEESDKVLGLESGADDYLTKPFGIRELVARSRAMLRRAHAGRAAQAPEHPEAITLPGLSIDPARRQVRVDDRAVELTTLEFELLYLLASRRGLVFSREMLLGRVWKDERHVTERSVDTLIKRIRKKIEPDPENPKYVLTVWGAGYKFADADA
jgi:DNA-binding response OmpR family regulator